MKKMFVAIAALGFMCAAAADSENVSVNGTYLGDYGMSFTVSSTVGYTTCVFPRVISRENVSGSVVPMTQLGPNERGLNIGQFIRSNPSRAWSIQVGARWRKGLCADQ